MYEEKPGYLNFCRVLAGENQLVWDERLIGNSRLWVEKAEGEGVAPLLYWHFKDGDWPGDMPEPVRGALTRIYYNTVAQNSLLYRELFKLLALFAEGGISAIVLKGGALVHGYYEDIGLRPMRDLDLLIPKHQVAHALDLIQTLGYLPAEVEISRGIHQQVSHNAYWRGGPDGRVGLELHWNLIAGEADARTVKVDWFWDQVEFVPGKGHLLLHHSIPQLHPTAHLLYLAAHLMLRHGGHNERLIWFYDVDRLIRSGRVDWALLETQAHTFGWGALVRYVLEGVAARFGTPLPAGLLGKLSEGEAWQAYLEARETLAGSFSRLDSTWNSLKYLSLNVRFRMIFALFFPSPDYICWRYQPHPEWSWPFFYFYRWAEVCKEVVYRAFPFVKQI